MKKAVMRPEYCCYPPQPRRVYVPEGERFRRKCRAQSLLADAEGYDPTRRAEVRRELMRLGVETLPVLRAASQKTETPASGLAKSVIKHLYAEEIGIGLAGGLDKHEAKYPAELGAAWLARLKDASLDPKKQVEEIQDLADLAAAKIAKHLGKPAADAAARGKALDVLYRLGEFWREEGFQGNTEDFQDPRNSWLPDVMERRTGLPITLSIVYLALCRRLGLEAHGVGLPWHFIVRVEVSTPETEGFLFIDPFHGARPLDLEDCRKLVEASGKSFDPSSDLAPASTRDILVRMCNNLINVFDQKKEPQEAERAATVLTHLCPDNPLPRMIRAERRLNRGELPLACEDLNAVLQLDRGGPVAKAANGLLRQVLFGYPT